MYLGRGHWANGMCTQLDHFKCKNKTITRFSHICSVIFIGFCQAYFFLNDVHEALCASGICSTKFPCSFSYNIGKDWPAIVKKTHLTMAPSTQCWIVLFLPSRKLTAYYSTLFFFSLRFLKLTIVCQFFLFTFSIISNFFPTRTHFHRSTF